MLLSHLKCLISDIQIVIDKWSILRVSARCSRFIEEEVLSPYNVTEIGNSAFWSGKFVKISLGVSHRGVLVKKKIAIPRVATHTACLQKIYPNMEARELGSYPLYSFTKSTSKYLIEQD